jgi:dihydroxyacid dehydratase/phosphogluconate dehydratase
MEREVWNKIVKKAKESGGRRCTIMGTTTTYTIIQEKYGIP